MTFYVGNKVSLFKNDRSYERTSGYIVVKKSLDQGSVRFDLGKDAKSLNTCTYSESLLTFDENPVSANITAFDVGEVVKVYSDTYAGYVFGIVDTVTLIDGEVRYTVRFSVEKEKQKYIKNMLKGTYRSVYYKACSEYLRDQADFVLYNISENELHKQDTRTEVFPIGDT
jgi:hypothetical protein